MTDQSVRRIDVDYLARVEGEGSMKVRVVDGVVEDVEFGIFEPPRFFEAFMRGRMFTEAPDITARICGICPIAYQMSSVHAMEDALGVTVGGQLRALRRLIYCGEWIESHGLHVYMLHAPDFLGYESAIHMAADHRELVERGLRLKKAGNTIVTVVGGREIHPINVRVGGFYRAPEKSELLALVDELEWARDAAIETVRFVAQLDIPKIEMDFELVSVVHPDEYPFNEGRLVSNKGLDIAASEFNDFFIEEHVARSNALHSRIASRGPYHVGPLARYALNFEKLHPLARSAALEAGLGPVCLNPFESIIVRSVEMVHACEEALAIIDAYQRPEGPCVDVAPAAGEGHGATEAPRGMLYHRYRLEDDGRIADAQIVPPTAQNQLTIEADLRAVLDVSLDLPDDDLTWKLEQTIRNYDPCISCATHFLSLQVERTES
ncbi:MAG TPA: Ni/Fe hydrogenase subunit alpha [Acidimicrobiia bacterium]|jgi:coenzyme F420-reducing hydrogenase alpha subunit|nr:Ni/Fe hydrogenase subunit alpha [Acidimicrobiia bacterium]